LCGGVAWSWHFKLGSLMYPAILKYKWLDDDLIHKDILKEHQVHSDNQFMIE